MMSSKITSQGNKEVSSTCFPDTLVISGTKMSRAKRQRIQKPQKKKKKKDDKDAEFWYRAMEQPDTKDVDKIVVQFARIEHRSWKEVQEIFIEKTGIFKTIPAMQMRVTRIGKRAIANIDDEPSILPVSDTVELPLENSQWPLQNSLFEDYNAQQKNYEDRITWNWNPVDQPFCQDVFSPSTCASDEMFEQDIARSGVDISTVGWGTSENVQYGDLWTRPDSSYTCFMPDISCSLQTDNTSDIEWLYRIQPGVNLPEYGRFVSLPYPDIEGNMSFGMISQ